MDYAGRLKSLIEEAGTTPNALAKKIGVDPSTIYKILSNDSKPSLPLLEKICNELDITMAEFFAPDLVELVLKKMESMHMSDEERAAYEVIKKMPPDKRQQSFLKTFEKYKNLSAKDREALDIIIDSLASSHQ
jgi:transcriptional regulator with XRE-family HTH domain